MKNRNTNKGITLIALVITIIVMLILVGVTISMAVNGGLFDYAGKATGDTKNAINAEQQLAGGGIIIGNTYYNSIDEYLNPEEETEKSSVKISLSISGTDVAEVPVPEGFTHTEGTIDTGYVIQDEAGNEFVWVPVKQGQKLSLKVESEKDIEEIKLYDPYGDEIDLGITAENVGKTYNKTEILPTANGMYMAVVQTPNGTNEDGTPKYEITQKTLAVKSLYAINTWNDWSCSDEYAQTKGYSSFENLALDFAKRAGYESVDEALQDMGYPTIEVAFSSLDSWDYRRFQDMTDYSSSVEANGGFYIARYEAGAPTARTSSNADHTVETIKSANGVPVSKEGYAPYILVTHGQALGLAESMYSREGFTDTLLTHSAWDRTLGWICETKGKTLAQICGDSGSWGNFYVMSFDITEGKYSENQGSSYTEVSEKYTKQKEDDVLLTTGATRRNFTNNIFDLAGNVREWTLSSATSSDGRPLRVDRGIGFIGTGYLDNPVTKCELYDTMSYCTDVGFRVALYLN